MRMSFSRSGVWRCAPQNRWTNPWQHKRHGSLIALGFRCPGNVRKSDGSVLNGWRIFYQMKRTKTHPHLQSKLHRTFRRQLYVAVRPFASVHLEEDDGEWIHVSLLRAAGWGCRVAQELRGRPQQVWKRHILPGSLGMQTQIFLLHSVAAPIAWAQFKRNHHKTCCSCRDNNKTGPQRKHFRMQLKHAMLKKWLFQLSEKSWNSM